MFSGASVCHPFIKDKTLPIYVANFVLMDYGTGAIFGCPAHDQRDLDFALKYKLEVLPVVAPKNSNPNSFKIKSAVYPTCIRALCCVQVFILILCSSPVYRVNFEMILNLKRFNNGY